jgi:hypothetical protein
MEYEGEADLIDNRYKSFKFYPVDKKWIARSIEEGEVDAKKVQEILKQQSAEKRIYLPDPNNFDKILNWETKINKEDLFYRSFIVEAEEGSVLSVVELRPMPRAVSFPKEKDQEVLLNYYQGEGLLTYNPENPDIDYFGKYRPVDDGKSSMLRMRLLPDKTIRENTELMSDIIKGTSAFSRALYDLNRSLPSYPTDKSQGLPKVIMSYTALEEPLKLAYKNAGFALNPLQEVAQYWPPEHRNQLPINLVNTELFVNTIDSHLMDFKEK